MPGSKGQHLYADRSKPRPVLPHSADFKWDFATRIAVWPRFLPRAPACTVICRTCLDHPQNGRYGRVGLGCLYGLNPWRQTPFGSALELTLTVGHAVEREVDSGCSQVAAHERVETWK